MSDAIRIEAGAWSRPDRGRLIQYGLSLVTVIAVAAPILPILAQSFMDRPLYEPGREFTLGNYVRLVSGGDMARLAGNTLLFAGGTTVFATLIGVVFAILVGRTNLPGRRIFGAISLWPMFLSSLIFVLGWVIIYGPAGYFTLMGRTQLGYAPWTLYSLTGMVLVAGVSQAPITFLYCVASTALSDATLEDAARSSGAGPLRTLRSVTLPLLLPSILYSAVLNFTSALEMLAIPLVLGGNGRVELFTTYLYNKGYAALRPDYGVVSTAAVFLIGVIWLLLFLQNRLLRNNKRFVTVGGKASRPRMLDLGWLRWPVAFVLALYCLFLILLPTGALVLRASVTVLSPLVPFWKMFTPNQFIAVFASESNLRAIYNTLVISALGAVIGTVFVALVAIVVHRSDFRFRRQLEYVALFPRAVPGLVAGMGFVYAMFLIPPLGMLRDTIWVLLVAYVMRYIPLAFGAISPAILQISSELDNSARTLGADWWTTSWAIVMKLIRPALFSSGALLFIFFLKEYTVAVFLFTPGSEVIGALLLNAWDRGQMGLLAAFASVQIGMTILFLLVARVALGVKVHG